MEGGGVGWVPGTPGRVKLVTEDLIRTELKLWCDNDVNFKDGESIVSELPEENGRRVVVHDPLASWNGIEFGDLLARAEMGKMEPLLDFSSDSVRCSSSSFFLPGKGDVVAAAGDAHTWGSNKLVLESQGGSVKETREGAIKEKLEQTRNSAGNVTTVDGNPSPEQGEKEFADLYGTPNQKSKRRKHRPKVITEGKVKRSMKETTTGLPPNSAKGAEKRRYVRKMSSGDTDNPTSKRKYVRKKSLGDEDNPTSKRKYVRKKGAPLTPSDEGGSVVDPKGSKHSTKSCRKVLDFEFDRQKNDDRPLPSPGVKENPILLTDSDTDQEQEFSNISGCRVDTQRVRRETKDKGDDLSKAKCSSVRTQQQLGKNGFKHACVTLTDLVHDRGDEHSSTTSGTSSTVKTANGKLFNKWWHCNPMNPPTSNTTVLDSVSNEKEVTETQSVQYANEEISSTTPGNQASLNNQNQRGSIPCIASTSSEDRPRFGNMGQFINGPHSTPIAPHVDAIWEYLISVDEIEERLKDLDINRETRSPHQRCNALVPFETCYETKSVHISRRNLIKERTELVIYNQNGSLVPYSQNKKRRPRAKVDIDEETSRVWRLLLENINSQGVNGTDEEKGRWWENERKVFSGRANSFIARMHLVQGDRRFSKWKGSVVDSVIGVFLTQNVSDHLSSSAFMSLAARFPRKPECNNEPYQKEGTCSANSKVEMHVIHPDDSVPLNSETSNDPICDPVSSVIDLEDIEQKGVSSCEGASNSGAMSSTEESDCKLSAFGSELQKFVETIGNQLNSNGAAEMSCVSEHPQSQLDEVVSSQGSATTYQSSQESLPSQTGDQNGLYSERNVDLYPAADFPSQAYGGSTSFLELLQMVGCPGNPDGGLRLDSSGQQDGADMSLIMEQMDQDQIEAGKRAHLTDSTESSKSSKGPTDRASKTVVKQTYASDRAFYESNIESLKAKRRRVGKDIDHRFDWEGLRKETQVDGKTRGKTPETMDSLDYEAVRCAEVDDIAYTIRERGMHNRLAGRIKDFLNRLVNEHGSIDLEWLRDVPPDQAKEYLLSIRGLGLKSVECVRLLTLHHLAFPVDTNVGRIAVRLGWVPLEPLPESLQLHLLEMYPVQESIQQYLWPRLCKLDQKTLYELHYQMITFGKVFCTKSKPNCNSCPMRGECRHFASAFASARLALPGPEEKRVVPLTEQRESNRSSSQVPQGFPNQVPLLPNIIDPQQIPQENFQIIHSSESQSRVISCEPIIEEPKSPEIECVQIEEKDIEDGWYDESDDIPEIKLNIEEFTQSLQSYIHKHMELEEGDVSRALVALTPEAASIPAPKLKNVSMLRTEHHVYELPDSHPLLEGLDRREPDDPCSYLLAIWTPGETATSVQPPEACASGENGKMCDKETCFSCNSSREANSLTVRGTLLIPCRTAMRGSFPLNGTYFQVNEVFADHDSSLNPMTIPRKWLWSLPRRTVYFGTSVPTIFKGLSTEGIQQCFWRGYVCVRGFDQKTRAPRPLLARLHLPASKISRAKGTNPGGK